MVFSITSFVPRLGEATCTAGFSAVQLLDPAGSETCTSLTNPFEPVEGAIPLASGQILVTGWWERCCHSEGQTDDLEPCTQQSLSAYDLNLFLATDEPNQYTPVDGDFERTDLVCSGQPVLRFNRELAAGSYMLTTVGPTFFLQVNGSDEPTDEPSDADVPEQQGSGEPTTEE